MSDRRTTLLLERLRSIAARKERFSYDVRGDSYVNMDIVAAYHIASEGAAPLELARVVEHALQHDAIVTGHRSMDGTVHFTSCRLFTDANNAVRFARDNQQSSVYNWNRGAEIPVLPIAKPEEPVAQE
jgi:hypothetical protein